MAVISIIGRMRDQQDIVTAIVSVVGFVTVSLKRRANGVPEARCDGIRSRIAYALQERRCNFSSPTRYGAFPVRLTIDSNDKLDQVLEAVGALFGVKVTTGGETPATDNSSASNGAAAPASRRRGAAKKAPASRGAGRGRASSSRASRSRPDSGAVRAWAKENGYDVSDRGRIPSQVVNAYQEANRG
jgi:hypothetical protein